jgi:vesicle-associated membrane protein 4
MSEPIKYLLIGNVDNSKIITEFTTSSVDDKSKKESGLIFSKICKKNTKNFEERIKISAKDSFYYIIIKTPNIIFLSQTDSNYAERLIFQLFDEIYGNNILQNINEETGELNVQGRTVLKELINKYQDNNKIQSIQNEVNEIQNDMKKNINHMVEGLEDVESLQQKSEELKETTKDYKKNAHDLEIITFWQHFKLWIILIGIILLIIIVIVLVFSN